MIFLESVTENKSKNKGSEKVFAAEFLADSDFFETESAEQIQNYLIQKCSKGIDIITDIENFTKCKGTKSLLSKKSLHINYNYDENNRLDELTILAFEYSISFNLNFGLRTHKPFLDLLRKILIAHQIEKSCHNSEQLKICLQQLFPRQTWVKECYVYDIVNKDKNGFFTNSMVFHIK